MVFLHRILGYATKTKPLPRKYLRSGFLDYLKLRVKAGAGGSGLPRYGGIGGSGGNVFLKAKDDINLRGLASHLRNTKIRAGLGGNSEKNSLIGKPGEDVIIDVPTGVSVFSIDGIFKGDLNKPESKLLVAKGGIGGCPDNGFCGQKGEHLTITLDLKLIADVALVGFPNAGKSTLLKTVSRANPKIASYPFTTVKPNVGIMEYKDLRTIKVADLPGLIEGAHENVGMGHKFLKHLDRCKVMLLIVDIQGFQLSPLHFKRNCLETVLLLNKEIELYQPDLLNMPAMLFVNKMDLDKSEEIFKTMEPKLKNLEEYLPHCPEPIRPSKAIKFEEIITTSLIKSSTHEVERIKNKIRYVLDETERKNQKINEMAEQELLEKIKRSTRQLAPNLI